MVRILNKLAIGTQQAEINTPAIDTDTGNFGACLFRRFSYAGLNV